MNIKLYIGTELLDFNEPINVVMSIGDIRDISLGNLNKSYTLNVPLTKTNRAIIKSSNVAGSTDEVTSAGRLFVNDMQIITGKVVILSTSDDHVKMIITADNWMDDLLNTDLRDIDFTAEDHTYNQTNIVASWSAADAFYRYPMINFGQLVTPATGAQPHDFGINDFIPMFRVIDLLTYIFSPLVIVSDWFSDTYAKTLYILGVEQKADSDFISQKDLEVHPTVTGDNSTVVPVTAGNTVGITLAKDPVVLNNETKDEGLDFSTSTYKYTTPENGTYRFLFTWASIGECAAGPFFDINNSSYTVTIKVNGSVISTTTYTDAAGDGAVNTSGTLNTGYIHLNANDLVHATVSIYANVTNNDASTRSFTIYLQTTTKLETQWAEWNRYPAAGKTITAIDYLPDIKAIDFVKAVKHFANLRFFFDRSNQKIYIEPAQSFYTTASEVDLTSFQDFAEINMETISQNYKKTIVLGFLEDDNDKAYTEYKETKGIPDRKAITLSSVYAGDGEMEILNNLFAHTTVGYFKEILSYLQIPRIYGNQEYVSTSKLYPAYRATGFKPRLMEWKGLTAGISFDIGVTTYTTYPKVLPVDFDDLYTNYWITSIHQIDKNKIVTINIKLPYSTLNQLRTVVAASASEGFRTRYKLLVEGQYVYGYLNNVTTDGDISECEFILKN